MTEQIISKEGFDKLEKELEYLTNEKRRQIAVRIQKAKDMGDLSENAEYSEAKDAQAFNEGRVAEITQILKNLTVVETNNGNGAVAMGSKVLASVNGEEKEFTIVSFNEADPLDGKISNESPLGKAFTGKKNGEKVIATTPKGDIEYQILKIS
ncbi:transcription elongation factor GreA [bacterium]|nr:transcription elongation factor GreA [bacterium]